MKLPSRILLVEDDPGAAQALAALLGQMGASEVSIKPDLHAAVTWAREQLPSLVFVGLSQVDCLPGSHADVRRCFTVPVVFSTSRGRTALTLGLSPAEYVAEPYREREVAIVVAAATAQARGQQRIADLERRLRREEGLADSGRTAARAGVDFGKLLTHFGELLQPVRAAAGESQLEAFSTLDLLLDRGHRLCRQLRGEPELPEDFPRRSRVTGAPFAPPTFHGAVLIVEDEESMRDLAGCVVKQMNLPVMMARSGEEAIERFQADPGKVGLLLLDLSLPKMSGLDVLAYVRAVRPAVPVVMVTGYGEEVLPPDVRGTLRGLLQKPFSPDALRALLQRVVAGDASPALVTS